MSWSFKQNISKKWQNTVGRTVTASTIAKTTDSGTLIRGNSGSDITIEIPSDATGWHGNITRNTYGVITGGSTISLNGFTSTVV